MCQIGSAAVAEDGVCIGVEAYAEARCSPGCVSDAVAPR